MKDFPITHRKLRANGIELHFAKSGEANAPLLILLHGFPKLSLAFRGIICPASPWSGCMFVAPDQRGYNLSEKPRGIDAYRLDAFTDDIANLASALGRETFQSVGHDWGGSVAWSIASRPARLQRMVVLNAPHPAVWIDAMRNDPDQRRKSWICALPADALAAGGARAARPLRRIRQSLRNRTPGSLHHRCHANLPRCLAHARCADSHAELVSCALAATCSNAGTSNTDDPVSNSLGRRGFV